MSRRTLSADTFVEKIDAMTQAALADAPTFASLMHRLPAIYPTEVLSSLDRLVTVGAISNGVAVGARQQAGRRSAAIAEGRSLLPVPHPLDYEWRFTPDASRALLDRAAAMTRAGGDLLLLGTPGLAVEALALPIDRRLAFLAEYNSVTQRVIALNRAIGSPLSIAFCSGGLPRETADAVLLDPPWYLDFVRPMLAAAAHACRVGGVVLISLPPFGTRPSAEADHHATIAFGRRLGLDLIEHDELAIGYETPFFERNALAASDIYPPPHWRRGDLTIFRKTRLTNQAPVTSGSDRRRPWIEASIGRMRLFIRRGDAATGPVELRSIIHGDILPSVSRRDPRRRLARVWTSGNRIFHTDQPQLLLDAAISCTGEAFGSGAQRRLWGTSREHEALDRVVGQLRELAALEAQEEQGVALGARRRSVPWTSRSTNCWSKSTATISG